MNLNSRSTIKDVAQKAGVSTQTVSRVINERPDVAIETRRRVLEVIEELGYRPSALARSLIQQRSFTLGVVTAGLKYIGPSRTLYGIAGEAAGRGYALLLEELPHFTATEIDPVLNSLLSHQVDGLLWAVPEIGDNRAWIETRLAEVPVPIVFLAMKPRAGIACISVDNYAGATLATRHLLEKNYKNIAHLSGPLEWWEAQERKRGWQDCLTEAGINQMFWIEGNWSSASGNQAIDQLLDDHPEIDAVFAANDQMALAVLSSAYRRGKRIPQDLAVVGFDDIAESAYFLPALTTIRQDQMELGCRAVDMLVKTIEAARQGEIFIPRAEMLTPELVVRQSS
jgi:LacI family transcriptional regulator